MVNITSRFKGADKCFSSANTIIAGWADNANVKFHHLKNFCKTFYFKLLVMVSFERAWLSCHTSRLSYSSRHRSIASGLNPFEVALSRKWMKEAVTSKA